jgi:zinc protease
VQRDWVACLSISLLLLATGGPARADGYAPFAAPLDIRLTNGLRIVAQRDARQPLVAFVIAYEVGTRDDPPGYEGLAHLIEHLTYAGSRHLGRYQMARELEHAGALRWNGATGPDYTEYYCLLSARHLALPFWLESERLGFTLERFDRQNLAHEKRILAKEALERAPSRVELEFALALFPDDHPYRVSRAGEDDASDVTLRGAQGFFQRSYRPDNATIVVVGDFDPNTLHVLAQRYFAPIPNPPGSFRRKPPVMRPFRGRERVVVTERRIPEVKLLMAWPAPPAGSPETETLWVLLDLLSKRGQASIDAAVRPLGVTESVSLVPEQRDGGGYLYLEMALRPEARPDFVEYAVEKLFFRLSRVILSEIEVRRAKDDIRTMTLSHVEDPLDHAQVHLESLRATGRPFRIADRFARVEAVTPASIRAFVKKYFDPVRRLSAWHRWPADGQDVSPSGEVTFEVGK